MGTTHASATGCYLPRGDCNGPTLSLITLLHDPETPGLRFDSPNDAMNLAAHGVSASKDWLAEVSADKGYASRGEGENGRGYSCRSRTLISGLFLASSEERRRNMGEDVPLFSIQARQNFSQHYHKRSNVETTFSMMKRKFGDGLRSKTDVAMVNETLCKILCHNLVVLIHEMCELGIDPVFWPLGLFS